MSTPLSSPIELLKTSYEIFKKDYKTYLKFSFFIYALYLASQILFFINTDYVENTEGRFDAVIINNNYSILIAFIAVAGVIVMFFGLIALIIFITDKEKREIQNYFTDARKKFWDALWTQVLTVIFFILGLVALIIPGIILSIYYSFGIYVVVKENLSGWSALKQSMSLVKNSWWAVAYRIICTGIFVLILSLPSVFFSSTGVSHETNLLLNLLYSVVISLFTLPIILIFNYQLYNQLVAQKSEHATDTKTQNI